MRSSKFIEVGTLVITSLLLAACASGPTAMQIKNADYGRDMTPEECVKIAEEFVSNAMKDPSSAQFKNSQCYKGYWNSVPLFGMPVAFGWIQAGEVNGKNSFGGYVGFRPYQILMKNGEVVRYCIADKDGLCITSGN